MDAIVRLLGNPLIFIIVSIVFLDILKIFKVFADFLTVRRRLVGPGTTVQNDSWGRNWLFPPPGNYGTKRFRGGGIIMN